MSFLLLYIGEGRVFDESLVRGFWAACPGVSALRKNAMHGAALDAEFMFEGDRTIIELKEDRETVALSGAGAASVQMSFLLQSVYPEPLHVIDDGYGFDFVIRDYETAQQLANAIHAALGAE